MQRIALDEMENPRYATAAKNLYNLGNYVVVITYCSGLSGMDVRC